MSAEHYTEVGILGCLIGSIFEFGNSGCCLVCFVVTNGVWGFSMRSFFKCYQFLNDTLKLPFIYTVYCQFKSFFMMVPSLSHLLFLAFWHRTLSPRLRSGNVFGCLSYNSLLWVLVLFIEISLFLIWWAQWLLILYHSLESDIESLKSWLSANWAGDLFIPLIGVFQCWSNAFTILSVLIVPFGPVFPLNNCFNDFMAALGCPFAEDNLNFTPQFCSQIFIFLDDKFGPPLQTLNSYSDSISCCMDLS